ncbi:UNVERIFIED_ORG: hypothetical protein J2W87_003280 [Pseudomonas putida]|nr:hypothetical protein [Pseudomonas putida]
MIWGVLADAFASRLAPTFDPRKSHMLSLHRPTVGASLLAIGRKITANHWD